MATLYCQLRGVHIVFVFFLEMEKDFFWLLMCDYSMWAV